MSRHNITGSEAFDRAPFVYVRGFTRRRGRRSLMMAALGGGAIVVGGIIALGLSQAFGF